jgi:protein-S-isoprenylcysteine O-methyltransferase Ste14
VKALELRIPPVAMTVLTGAAMWVTAESLPSLVIPLPPIWRAGIGVALAAAGIWFALAGVGDFRRASTTVNPLAPEATVQLVTDGVYRRTRNPMYLGMLLMLAGWAVALAHLTGPLFLLLFAMYITRFQILPEERALQAQFGDEFSAYRRRVKRWF